jgi:formylglycine-generating enzyme required for sulfatase activity
MKRFRFGSVLGAAVLLKVPMQAQTGGRVAFASDIAPMLEEHCVTCHYPDRKLGDLDITSRAELMASKAVVAGQPDVSPLYTLSAMPSDRAGAMPPGGPRLSDENLAVLRRWIEQGADWPAGATLKTPPPEQPFSDADPREVVRRIHERVTSRARESTGKAQPYSVTVPHTTVTYQMVPIPAGDFVMGSPDSDPARKPDEQPAHAVHVEAFWMQAHEVTWDEYRLFMFANQAGETANPDSVVDAVSRPTRPYVEMSFGMGINGFPAISMTQHAANQYAQWLSAKTGEFYRLPTEAEWEYACRAASSTPYFFGSDASPLGDFAWYSANSDGKYQQVATKKPNAWGLFDISGNVMEWTLDAYAPYRGEKAANPWVKATQPYPHAVRGGSWRDDAEKLRCAARVPSDPSWKQQDPQLPKSIWYHTDAQWLGFRLVRPAKIPTADEMYNYWYSGVEQDDF